MATKRFLIAPLNSGLQTNVKPWLIADDAYAELNNMFLYKGRLRKRFGSRYMTRGNPLSSRLRILVDTTDGSGNASGTIPWATSGSNPSSVGQLFSVATDVYTVTVAGTPGAMLATTGSGTFNTTTGAYTITGATTGTSVYYYPALRS